MNVEIPEPTPTFSVKVSTTASRSHRANGDYCLVSIDYVEILGHDHPAWRTQQVEVHSNCACKHYRDSASSLYAQGHEKLVATLRWLFHEAPVRTRADVSFLILPSQSLVIGIGSSMVGVFCPRPQ